MFLIFGKCAILQTARDLYHRQDVDVAKLHVRVPGLWPSAGLQHHQVLQGDGRSEFRAAGKSTEDLFAKFFPFVTSSGFTVEVFVSCCLDLSAPGSWELENVSVRCTEKDRLDKRSSV